MAPRRLTVKLRGRAKAPNQSRGCTPSSGTRGETTAPHGPPKRWLGGVILLMRIRGGSGQLACPLQRLLAGTRTIAACRFP
jgi:hypothetical protein